MILQKTASDTGESILFLSLKHTIKHCNNSLYGVLVYDDICHMVRKINYFIYFLFYFKHPGSATLVFTLNLIEFLALYINKSINKRKFIAAERKYMYNIEENNYRYQIQCWGSTFCADPDPRIRTYDQWIRIRIQLIHSFLQ